MSDVNINDIPKKIELLKISNLVLSGGGMLGLGYIGLFRYLEEKGVIASNQLKTITGCSAGAAFGTFLSLGYTSSELEIIFKTFNFKDYIKISADALIRFLCVKGIENGNNLRDFIKNCIKNKTNDENITFLQAFKKYNITLQIGITNLTKSQFELLNYKTHPDVPIYNAIIASMSIPFVFEPVNINGDLCCDGGIIDNLPVDYIDNSIIPSLTDNDNITINTLGIYLHNIHKIIDANNYKTVSLLDYFNSVLSSTSFVCRERANKKNEKYKVIVIEIPSNIMTFLKLDITNTDFEIVINLGYNTVKTYFD